MKPFSHRIAQLDLARQMETPEFIRSFIDLLSANHYTMLMLYLEDRVITPSFPYPSPAEAYTMDQIRELVAYGAGKGIELFPCIATLGHAELFLKFPELQHFAEVKNGLTGRFGGTQQNTFCVSEPGFYEFLETYLSEVASLFPSKFFHIGLDEFWDFNRCPKCKAQAPDFAGEERLFLKHICKVHDILTSLGKRTVMWTDMFENYTHILPDVPRDVIMVEWQYQFDVRFNLAHFDNSANTNNFRHFIQLGFDVWLAPYDMQLTNPVSAVEYARQFPQITGMLLTSWERSDAYWPRYLPIFAITGQLFAGKDVDTALSLVTPQLFGISDPRFIQLLKTILSQFFTLHFQSARENMFFSRAYLGLDTASHEITCLILQEMLHWQSALIKGQDIWNDLIQLFQEMQLAETLKKNFVDSLDFGLTPQRLQAIQDDFTSYRQLFANRIAQWDSQRPGIRPNVLANRFSEVDKSLDASLQKLQNGAFLKLRLMHDDWHGVPKLTISLKLNGTWHQIESRALKPDNLSNSLVDYFVAIPRDYVHAEAMRLDYAGYGGVGIAYAELRADGKCLQVPDHIQATGHTVVAPENMTTDNACWTFLGEQAMHPVFCNQELSQVKSGVEVSFKPSC